MKKNLYNSSLIRLGHVILACLVLGLIFVQAPVVHADSSATELTQTQNTNEGYDREGAVSWANSNNRHDGGMYGASEGRYCTTFVTKALRAGGLDVPIFDSNTAFAGWLRNNTSLWEVRPLDQLEKGDFIFFKKDGPIPDDLSAPYPINHSVFVTGPGIASAWNAEQMNKPFSWWYPGAFPYSKGVHIKAPTIHRTVWIFQNNSQGWVILSGIGGNSFSDGGWVLNISANDPYIASPQTSFAASDYPYLYIQMASQTDNCGQVYFATQDSPVFADDKEIDLPIVADGATKHMILDMASHPLWAGTITQLRLDPACTAVGNKAVRVDRIALLSNRNSWSFSADSQGWVIENAINNPWFSEGGWVMNISGTDPYIHGPMINLPAQQYRYLVIDMVSENDDCGQIFFANQDNPIFNDTMYQNFPIIADGAKHRVLLDMARSPNWTGNIIQLRLDPACVGVTDKAVRIDQVYFVNIYKAYMPIIKR